MENINYAISYPELSEQGKQNTAQIIDKFKKQLEELMNDTLYSFTCNIANEITNDDSWINVRQKTKDALCAYMGTENYGGVNWERVRKIIFEENRDAIVNDLIEDKQREIDRLNEVINNMATNRW